MWFYCLFNVNIQSIEVKLIFEIVYHGFCYFCYIYISVATYSQPLWLIRFSFTAFFFSSSFYYLSYDNNVLMASQQLFEQSSSMTKRPFQWAASFIQIKVKMRNENPANQSNRLWFGVKEPKEAGTMMANELFFRYDNFIWPLHVFPLLFGFVYQTELVRCWTMNKKHVMQLKKCWIDQLQNKN